MKGFHLAFLLLSMTFFRKNPICNTVKSSKLQFLTFEAIPQEAWLLFVTKDIQNVLKTNILCGFQFFFMKFQFYFNFQKVTTDYFAGHALLIADRCSGALFRKRRELS